VVMVVAEVVLRDAGVEQVLANFPRVLGGGFLNRGRGNPAKLILLSFDETRLLVLLKGRIIS